jgi:hypothetical protein
MTLGEGITIYATEEARMKWQGKERPKKCKTPGCPSCEIKRLKKEHEHDENSREE